MESLSISAEPLRDAHGTPGFRETPVEKHCARLSEIAKDIANLHMSDNLHKLL
jgi:hypothetical protein